MTTDAEERSAWPRNGQVIRRGELLRLIEENRGPKGLDLRGAIFVGDGASDDPRENPIDLSPDALAPLTAPRAQANEPSRPQWLSVAGINLRGAHLQGAVLRDAQLQGADLIGAQLQGAFLVGAQLRGAVLVGAELRRVDMYEVETLDGAHWRGAHLDQTLVRRESLGKATGDEIEAHDNRTAEAYSQATEAYLLLKNNFNQIGRYEDASWAYVKEQQMEKMAYYWEWHFWGWRVWRARGFFWRSFWRWLRNWAYELATGYGERPWNAVRAGLVAILAFAAGFWACGITGGRGAVAFLDCLVYSIATFATFNLARPNLNPTGRGIEIASSLEAILGIAVLALVVFTVGNRMSRS